MPTHHFVGSRRSASVEPVCTSVSMPEPSRFARITRMPSRSRPVELAAALVELELLRREGGAFGHDRGAVAPVEVGALDRAVVAAGHAHVGPVEVPGLDVDGDAVRKPAAGRDDLPVGAVRIRREHAALRQVEEETASHVLSRASSPEARARCSSRALIPQGRWGWLCPVTQEATVHRFSMGGSPVMANGRAATQAGAVTIRWRPEALDPPQGHFARSSLVASISPAGARAGRAAHREDRGCDTRDRHPAASLPPMCPSTQTLTRCGDPELLQCKRGGPIDVRNICAMPENRPRTRTSCSSSNPTTWSAGYFSSGSRTCGRSCVRMKGSSCIAACAELIDHRCRADCGGRTSLRDGLQRLEQEYAHCNELDAEWAARPLALLRDHGADACSCGSGRRIAEPPYRTALGSAAVPASRNRHWGGPRSYARTWPYPEDLKPANILVDPVTGAARLTGFAMAPDTDRQERNPLDRLASDHLAPWESRSTSCSRACCRSPPPIRSSGSTAISPACRCRPSSAGKRRRPSSRQ